MPGAPLNRQRVVVVGAGFGGLAAARELRNADVEVTIVDRHNYHTFQPLLYQVATAGLNAADVAYAVRGIFHRQPNASFRQAAVTGVDWDANELHLERDGVASRLAFDHLILAAGATASYFGVTGAKEHGFPLYSLNDAVQLRNHILDQFEAADADPSLLDDGALTFVVVGGGPTGVEVAGALAELFHVVGKDFPHLDVGRARVLLVEMAGELLPPFRLPSRTHALEALQARGVDVRLVEAVEAVTPTAARLRSGESVPTHTLVWAAGVRPNPLVDVLGLPQGRGGRIVVGQDLTVPTRPEVSVVGDLAEITDARHGVLPQLAPVAMQSGRHAARQIVRRANGLPTQRFRYRDKGTMATIGRRAAVAELPFGLCLSGTPAWLAWLGLHLLYLIGFRNRVSVLLNWGWSYLTWDRGPRLILRPDADQA